MNAVFPFGFELPTVLYLALYVVTLVIHVAFMNYVLAGTGMMAWRGILRVARERPPSRAHDLLKDWMPAMLSGAVTAGVAPLLFVQILYKQNFYTANLLLSHRWMSILPILIVGGYALYLLKSGWAGRQAAWVTAIISIVPFLAVAFTGYSWTENHLLSVRDPAYWAEFYAQDVMVHYEPQLVPRLAVWVFGSLPTVAIILGVQLAMQARGQDSVGDKNPTTGEGGALGPVPPEQVRTLALLALTGIGLSVFAGPIYLAVADATTRQAFFSVMALPYLAIAVVGVVAQTFAWLLIFRTRKLAGKVLWMAGAGCAATLLGMSVCREAVRLLTLGEERFALLVPQHQQAAGIGGIGVFLFFFVLNIALIALCFVLVKRGRKQPAATPSARPELASTAG